MNSSCCQARCAHQAGALIHGRPALAGGEHVSDVTNWAGRIPAAALARRIAPVGHRCRSPHSAGYRPRRRGGRSTRDRERAACRPSISLPAVPPMIYLISPGARGCTRMISGAL